MMLPRPPRSYKGQKVGVAYIEAPASGARSINLSANYFTNTSNRETYRRGDDYDSTYKYKNFVFRIDILDQGTATDYNVYATPYLTKSWNPSPIVRDPDTINNAIRNGELTQLWRAANDATLISAVNRLNGRDHYKYTYPPNYSFTGATVAVTDAVSKNDMTIFRNGVDVTSEVTLPEFDGLSLGSGFGLETDVEGLNLKGFNVKAGSYGDDLQPGDVVSFTVTKSGVDYGAITFSLTPYFFWWEGFANQVYGSGTLISQDGTFEGYYGVLPVGSYTLADACPFVIIKGGAKALVYFSYAAYNE